MAKSYLLLLCLQRYALASGFVIGRNFAGAFECLLKNKKQKNTASSSGVMGNAFNHCMKHFMIFPPFKRLHSPVLACVVVCIRKERMQARPQFVLFCVTPPTRLLVSNTSGLDCVSHAISFVMPSPPFPALCKIIILAFERRRHPGFAATASDRQK